MSGVSHECVIHLKFGLDIFYRQGRKKIFRGSSTMLATEIYQKNPWWSNLNSGVHQDRLTERVAEAADHCFLPSLLILSE